MTITTMVDWGKALLASSIIFVAMGVMGGSIPVLSVRWVGVTLAAAQQILPNQGDVTPMPTQEQATLLQWAFQQGGAFVVVLCVLFFYRRDFLKKDADNRANQQLTADTLIPLCKDAIRAQTECAAALRENTVVTHGVKRVFERQFPERRQET